MRRATVGQAEVSRGRCAFVRRRDEGRAEAARRVLRGRRYRAGRMGASRGGRAREAACAERAHERTWRCSARRSCSAESRARETCLADAEDVARTVEARARERALHAPTSCSALRDAQRRRLRSRDGERGRRRSRERRRSLAVVTPPRRFISPSVTSFASSAAKQRRESYVVDDTGSASATPKNADLVREHARRGGFRADAVVRVRSVIDPTTAES